MRKVRVYINDDLSAQAPPQGIQLSPSDAHHLWEVLRLECGAKVSIFDRTGREYQGELLAEKGAVRVVKELTRPKSKFDVWVTVFQAPPRAGRLDDVIRPLSELGTFELRPLITERSIDRSVKSASDNARWAKRLERWQRIALESAKQCGRPQPLRVAEPISFDAALDMSRSFDGRFLLDPFAEAPPDWTSLRRPDGSCHLALFIGPEGGFSLDENERALAAGLKPLRISPHVLRCETAGLSAMAIVQFMVNLAA